MPNEYGDDGVSPRLVERVFNTSLFSKILRRNASQQYSVGGVLTRVGVTLACCGGLKHLLAAWKNVN